MAEMDHKIGGKFLTFRLGSEEYGVEILKVREIMGLQPITPVPQTPAYVLGVINLRGRIIPIVDLRIRFGMSQQEDREVTCIIVVEVCRDNQESVMGIRVDEVAEVSDIPNEKIDPAPGFGADVDTRFIQGLGKLENKVVILPDIDRVLSKEELESLVAVGAEEA